MNALVAVLALAASPVSFPEKVDSCDLLEVNHLYDPNGAHNLSQVLFYEWDGRGARYQIRGWRLLKSTSQFPRVCPEGYETVWREGATPCRVTAPQFRETWTQYDPELNERKHLARELRHELFSDPNRLPPACRELGNDPIPPAPENVP